MSNLADLKLMFLDLQTTGASPATGSPLEIAWVVASASEEKTTSRRFLIKQPTDEPLPRRIQALTGITDGDMVDAIDWSDVRNELTGDLANSAKTCFVIHYAQFERPFLRTLFDNFDAHYQLLCTHQIATRVFPNLPSRGIRGLAGYFGNPLEECKRANTHVEATYLIWKSLCVLLAEKGVDTWDALNFWIASAPKEKRTKYEYPLERKVRLAMPDCPGIYKMLSRRGDVLYVGKATSLKDRVNSYFRGRKHRDPKKLEMLTQAWDIKVEPCETVLEACLLEVREIKRLAPPYNIALKTGIRPLLFYSPAFDASSLRQCAETPVGPFRNEFILDGFTRLLHSLRTGEWDPLIFFDEIEPATMQSGFEIFLSENNVSSEQIMAPRSALALGAWLARRYAKLAELLKELEELEAACESAAEAKAGNSKVKKRRKRSEPTPEEEQIKITPSDVARKLSKLLAHAARSYFLSRRLTKLLNARVTFSDGHVKRTLAFDNAVSDQNFPWEDTTTETFDVLRTLHTELNRLRKSGETIEINA